MDLGQDALHLLEIGPAPAVEVDAAALALEELGAQLGLPVGIQIVGRQYDDLTCLHMAGLIEEGYYRFTPPPGY